jgi:2-keto-4-pentenoate hydratase/2-oxohepta-3-ene-1,7-dioic acid hydratase in catechol pathway
MPTGKFPIAFTKPPGALAGPFEDVPFSKALEEMDYEVHNFFLPERA